jgi:hypothetical protein
VLEHFDNVVWVPLGATPDIKGSLDLIYQQLTGCEMNRELDNDGRQEAVKQAMSKRNVLLCLDDCWDEKVPAELIFLDHSTTHSRALISSRVRETLIEAETHVIDIGLPSESDAVQIVMAAAGMPVDAERLPNGVKEITVVCKRLPLTLGIAGRLARQMGMALQDDWSDVLECLRDEHQAGSSVDHIVATSLRSITGQYAHQARTMLLSFALIPEDTAGRYRSTTGPYAHQARTLLLSFAL